MNKPRRASLVQGHATTPSRLSGSRDTSSEVDEFFLAVGPTINLNTTQATGSSGSRQRNPTKRMAPDVATDPDNWFYGMSTPPLSPHDPVCTSCASTCASICAL
jgi:hypothetical protein